MTRENNSSLQWGHLNDTIPSTWNETENTNSAAAPAAAAASTTGSSSLLFGKPSNGSVLFGKSSSLIFPTGVETGSVVVGRGTSIGSIGRASSTASSSGGNGNGNGNGNGGNNSIGGGGGGGGGNYNNGVGGGSANNLKRRRVNLLLDQCETVRFPFKKKLILNDLGLTASDVPVKDLCGTPLGQSLHKLSLAGNRLGHIPNKLVTNLPLLKHLDFSQCELHHLPETWYLPSLRRLNLGHNRLTDFPEEVCFYFVLFCV